jgi:hypothetical protein
MHRFTVDVGWTSQRPIRPEQHTSRIVVMAEDGHDAELTALLMVAARPSCVMPTSSTVIDW